MVCEKKITIQNALLNEMANLKHLLMDEGFDCTLKLYGEYQIPTVEVPEYDIGEVIFESGFSISSLEIYYCDVCGACKDWYEQWMLDSDMIKELGLDSDSALLSEFIRENSCHDEIVDRCVGLRWKRVYDVLQKMTENELAEFCSGELDVDKFCEQHADTDSFENYLHLVICGLSTMRASNDCPEFVFWKGAVFESRRCHSDYGDAVKDVRDCKERGVVALIWPMGWDNNRSYGVYECMDSDGLDVPDVSDDVNQMRITPLEWIINAVDTFGFYTYDDMSYNPQNYWTRHAELRKNIPE